MDRVPPRKRETVNTGEANRSSVQKLGDRLADFLSRESIIALAQRKLGVPRRLRVETVTRLRYFPLGMFFYNQRAIFLLCSLLFCGVLTLILYLYDWPAGDHRGCFEQAIWLLSMAWGVTALTTAALHRQFVKRLDLWKPDRDYDQMPEKFEVYFLVDSLVLIAVLVIGLFVGLPLHPLVMLLVLNVVIFGTYVGQKRRKWVLVLGTAAAALIILYATLGREVTHGFPGIILAYGPIVGGVLFALPTISIVMTLRHRDKRTAERRSHLMTEFASMLQPRELDNGTGQDAIAEYDSAVGRVLQKLCSDEEHWEPLWYRSGCLWYMHYHQDRGHVWFAGPRYQCKLRARALEEGLTGFPELNSDRGHQFVISQKRASAESTSYARILDSSQDAPAALVRAGRTENQLGALVLRGSETGPPIRDHSHVFLNAIAAYMAEAHFQARDRKKLAAVREMDALFAEENPDIVFETAAQILKSYLGASGCLILYREDVNAREFAVKARPGFDDSLSVLTYKELRSGKCQSWDCVSECRSIKWDDVQKNLAQFNLRLLRRQEKALGESILSWMAIPIGDTGEVHGAIKVMNAKGLPPWFTDFDMELAEMLAVRLHEIIRRSLQFKKTEKALARAENSLRAAQMTAKAREEDLMILTHQVVGPMASIAAGLSLERNRAETKRQREALERLSDLVEDVLCAGIGTYTAFARDLGRDTVFSENYVDAPSEMSRLADRLKRTSSRDDLEFRSKTEDGFPTIVVDKNAFISIMYSLIHNATKYADRGSAVDLECTFERSSGQPAMKVKSIGEPIGSHETERVFEKFGRGHAVEQGRHHGGVGLGLWVARKLARDMGGDLYLEKSPMNERLSVFVLTLPAGQE